MLVLYTNISFSCVFAVCEFIINRFLSSEETCDKEGQIRKATRFIRILRLVVSVLASLFEVAIGIGLFVVYLKYSELKATNHITRLFYIIGLFYTHGNQILLAAGIFSMIILLPVEEYTAKKYREESYERIADSAEEGGHSELNHSEHMHTHA